MMYHTKTIQASKRDTSLASPLSHHTCYYTKWQLLQQQIRNNCTTLMFDFRQAINIVEKQTIMVVGRDDMNRLVVHLYIPEKKTWSLSHEIKIHPDRDQMAYAYYNGKLFLIGGMDMFQRFQPDVNIFDVMTQSVKEGPQMRVCRTKASVGCDGRIAYVVGGLNRFDNWMTHVECLDMGSELWGIIPSMKEKRETPGVVTVNGELFIVSGFTNRCEKYDPYLECWKEVIPMPEFFSQTTVFCCEFEGKLYAFRYFKPDRVCCLDVTKNVWTVFRSMGNPPDRIVCMMNIGNEFWTMDQFGKLYVYDALINFWSSCFVVPKSLTRPMKLFALNAADLKESEKTCTATGTAAKLKNNNENCVNKRSPLI
uniref:Uncharacterized protein n=1 Tax=Strigamia maritima TaxID=126957 RepID=T1J9B5_STRMM